MQANFEEKHQNNFSFSTPMKMNSTSKLFLYLNRNNPHIDFQIMKN